jgi:hypothetical protein
MGDKHIRTVKRWLAFVDSIEAKDVGHAVDLDMERDDLEDLRKYLQADVATEAGRSSDHIEIADDTPEWIKKYLRETEFETVEALRAAYLALMRFKPGSGAALECPYACGWEALRSIITENAVYFARATMDDEVPEPVRQAGIAGNRYAIELCRAAMSAPAPHPEGDGLEDRK